MGIGQRLFRVAIPNIPCRFPVRAFMFAIEAKANRGRQSEQWG
jgi:hypothetical protein